MERVQVANAFNWRPRVVHRAHLHTVSALNPSAVTSKPSSAVEDPLFSAGSSVFDSMPEQLVPFDSSVVPPVVVDVMPSSIVVAAPSVSIAPSVVSVPSVTIADPIVVAPPVVVAPPSVTIAGPIVVAPPVVLAPPVVPTRVSARGSAHPAGFWRGASALKLVNGRVTVAPAAGRVMRRVVADVDGFIPVSRKHSFKRKSAVLPQCLVCSDEEAAVSPATPAVDRFAMIAAAVNANRVARVAQTIKVERDAKAEYDMIAAAISAAIIERGSSASLSGTHFRDDSHSLLPVASMLADSGVSDGHTLAWFNTQRPDEFDVDGAAAWFDAGTTPAVAAFVAAGTACVNDDDVSRQLRPVPSSKGKEVSLSAALPTMVYAQLERATLEEIDKQQRTGCLGLKVYSVANLEKLPVGSFDLVRAHCLFKQKPDRFTGRIAGMGNLLPVEPDAVNFSAVCSDDHKMFALALAQATCEKRGEQLNLRDFDIKGAFLHVKRDSPRRMFLLFPRNLPHPLAGKLLEVFGALYGLRESNRLFSLEVDRVLRSAGFASDPLSPMLYFKHHPDDPGLFVLVSTHVDDFGTKDNCSSLTDSLHAALVSRFGEITEHNPSTSFAGVSIVQHSNGAVEVHQAPYIERVAGVVGVAHMPPIDSPSLPGVFSRSVTLADRACVNIDTYTSVTGHLIQMLKTRDDVRPIVSYLCSRNSAPDVGDYNKALRVLRYLHSTRRNGKVFKSSSTSIVGRADAGFGSHDNGCSQEAFFVCVGDNNAPFACVARAQVDVATCPMTAEYMSSAGCAKCIMQYRWLAAALGWPPDASTSMKVDCATARRLAIAPEITRKALHIHVKYHFVRQCVARGEIVLDLVSSKEMRADVLTKYFPPPIFRRLADGLLNRAALLV